MSAEDDTPHITFEESPRTPTVMDRYWDQEARRQRREDPARLEAEARRWVAAIAAFVAAFGLAFTVAEPQVAGGGWAASTAGVLTVLSAVAAVAAGVGAYAAAFPAPESRLKTGPAARLHAEARAQKVASTLRWVRGLTGFALLFAVTASILPVVVNGEDPDRLVRVSTGGANYCGILKTAEGVVTLETPELLVVLPSDDALEFAFVHQCPVEEER